MESVVVGGKDSSWLDPVLRRGDAVGAGHFGSPRQQEGVDHAVDGPSARTKAGNDRREALRADALVLGEEVVDIVSSGLQSFVVAIGEGNEGDGSVGDFLVRGSEVGEHFAVSRHGSGEGYAGSGGLGEAVCEVDGRVNVALGWECEYEYVFWGDCRHFFLVFDAPSQMTVCAK